MSEQDKQDDVAAIEALLTPDPWRPAVSPANAPTVVWYTNEGFYEPATKQYVVARVTEDERGYDAWSRHDTIEEARQAADGANRTHGVVGDDILRVVASSMRLTHADRKEQYLVTYTTTVWASSPQDAAREVANDLGEDYAQRASYIVNRVDAEDWESQIVDLGDD
jgi:hypothetical protein